MLDELQGDLWIAWQPIYNLRSGAIWGHEALIRGPEGHPFHHPADLFQLARLEGVEEEFEETCRFLAFRTAERDLGGPGILFVNANPRFVGLPIAPPEVRWQMARTVVEIPESSPLFDDPEALQAQVTAWRDMGCRIALDDFGSGFSGEAAILALRPDIVKVDQRFVRGIDRDRWRQEIVSAIVHMCSDLGVAVIAEGVETAEEFSELVLRGVTMGQGFLFGRPAREPRLTPLAIEPSEKLPMDVARQAAAKEEGLPRYVVDRARRVLFWSPEAAELTGFAPEAMTGVTCWLSGLDHRDANGSRLCFRACPLVTAMQTGEQQRGVITLRTAEGARRWVEVRAEPVLGERGEPIGAVETFVAAETPPTDASVMDLGDARPAPSLGLAHQLFWRKEIARWLVEWQKGGELQELARRCVETMPLPVGAIWRPEPERGQCVVVASKGCREEDESLAPQSFGSEQGIVAGAFRRGEIVRAHRDDALPSTFVAGDRLLELAIPLVYADSVQAVLTLGVDGSPQIPRAAVEAIEEVAPLLGSVIASSALHERLQRDSELFRWIADELARVPLTPIPNALAHAFRGLREGLGREAGVRGGVLFTREDPGGWLQDDAWGTLARVDWEARSSALDASRTEGRPLTGWLAEDHPLYSGRLPIYVHEVREAGEVQAILLLSVAYTDFERELRAAVALAELSARRAAGTQGGTPPL